MDVVVGGLAVIGSLLVALAGLAVLRFSDLYARMHAATKASTGGVALIGIAGALAIDGGASRILLASAVIFITAPSAAHFIGRTAYRVEGVDVRLDGEDDLRSLIEEDG